MSIFDYQASIKITFDKPILTNPEVVIGTEYYVPVPLLLPVIPIGLGTWSGSSPLSRVFDNNTATYGYVSGTYPFAAGINFREVVPISVVRLYVADSSGPKDYQVQYSDDGSTWNTIASGQFTTTVGWQTVEFAEESHQYWRLLFTSSWTGGTYAYVYEVVFCTIRNVYDVAAWTVTGQEYKYRPGTDVIDETYTVRKVTKAPDNMSVTLWLDLKDRMTDPYGPVTVSYSKILGNLAGDFDSAVEDFTLQFTPTNIVPYSQPHVSDNVSARGKMTVSTMEVTYKYIPSESDTFLVLDLDNQYMKENISAQAKMTVAVTKVGDLPL